MSQKHIVYIAKGKKGKPVYSFQIGSLTVMQSSISIKTKNDKLTVEKKDVRKIHIQQLDRVGLIIVARILLKDRSEYLISLQAQNIMPEDHVKDYWLPADIVRRDIVDAMAEDKDLGKSYKTLLAELRNCFGWRRVRVEQSSADYVFYVMMREAILVVLAIVGALVLVESFRSNPLDSNNDVYNILGTVFLIRWVALYFISSRRQVSYQKLINPNPIKA